MLVSYSAHLLHLQGEWASQSLVMLHQLPVVIVSNLMPSTQVALTTNLMQRAVMEANFADSTPPSRGGAQYSLWDGPVVNASLQKSFSYLVAGTSLLHTLCSLACRAGLGSVVLLRLCKVTKQVRCTKFTLVTVFCLLLLLISSRCQNVTKRFCSFSLLQKLVYCVPRRQISCKV